MSVIEKGEFLYYVQETIEKNPLWVADTVRVCNQGLEKAFDKLIRSKSELEVALAFSLGVGCKKAQLSEYIKDKLKKAEPHSLRWDWFLGGEHARD